MEWVILMMLGLCFINGEMISPLMENGFVNPFFIKREIIWLPVMHIHLCLFVCFQF